MLGGMPRAPRGAVIERPRADGLTSFCLRFSAYGTRRFETLGTDEDGWTPARAAAELRKVLSLVEAGVWRPDEELSVARALDPDVTFGVYAAEWVRRWRGGEFGDPPDEATVKDYVDWRLDKHLLPFFSSTPIVGLTADCARGSRRTRSPSGRRSRRRCTRARISVTCAECACGP
jgi:hypothetical protein